MRYTAKQALGFFIIGAATGAVLSLLYAPKSGVQTRKNIRRLTRRTVDRLDDLQENVRDQVGTWVDDINDRVHDSVKSGRKLSAETYEHVVGAFDTAKKVIENGRQRLEKILA